MRTAPRSLLGISSSFPTSLLTSLLTIGVAGCLHASPDDGGERPDPGTDPDPGAEPTPAPRPTPVPPPPPPLPVPGGAYQVTTQLDLTVEALLPQPAADMVVTLRDFSTEPAHTLITLADEAGVPAVAELRAALPDALESRLEGWIDEEIAKLKLGGVPVTQVAAEAAALAETTLTRVAVKSELSIDGNLAAHRLTALDFHPAGLDAVLPLAALPGDVVTASAAATATAGALTLGDHEFGLAYGEYAWAALEAACTQSHGAALRPTLGAAVNCPALAARIASKCFLGVCVGHTAALTQLCERGLDEAVDRAHEKLAAVRFTALHLAAGTATPADGANRLTGGVWTAEINAGMGLRTVPATFTATR